MKPQFNFFDGAGGTRNTEQDLPEGFRYRRELISRAEEAALLTHVRELPMKTPRSKLRGIRRGRVEWFHSSGPAL